MVVKNCKRCNKEFNTYSSHFERRMYCSRYCKGKTAVISEKAKLKLSSLMKESWKNGTLKSKEGCNKGGRNPSMIGELNPNWKGGTTKLIFKIRALPEMKKWREGVFKRDNYVCVECNKKKRNINADHILPLSIIIFNDNIKSIVEALMNKKIWDIENGQTLCEECHLSKTKIDLIDIRKMTYVH